MNTKSNEEYEQERSRQVSKVRSVLDYAMGTVIVFIGLFLIFRYALNIPLNKIYPPDIFDKVYGVLALIYGLWRLYRAYKKK
jgi:cytochrome c biogenesis protein CcdA